MPKRTLHVGFIVAVYSVASLPGIAWIPPESRGERPAGTLSAPRLAEIPAGAWDRMLETIAGDGYLVRAPAVGGTEETPGNGSSTRRFTEEAILRASDAQTEDRFGISVAICGDTAIVGAESEDGGAGDPLPGAGAAYVFGRDQGGTNNWGELAKLTASDAQVGDRFGDSVAISGDTAIVGARDEDGGAGDPLTAAGAAYVFRESSLRFFIGSLLPEPGVRRSLIPPR